MSFEDADIDGWDAVLGALGRTAKNTKIALVMLGLICLVSFGAGLHAGLFG